MKTFMDKKTKYYAYAEDLFVILKPSLDYFSREDLINYANILERYKFKERKETDDLHSNTKKDHLKRKKADNKTSKGLARATLRSLDPHYNARTSNNTKNSLVELIKKEYSKTFIN